MNEPQVTVIGNVTQDVRHVRTEHGVPITTFRIASTRRQYDRAAGRWVDGETTFMNVTCWRALAENVRASVSKGDPVVVIGKLRIRAWERDGRKGNAVEIDASTVGHDMVRGTSLFRRATPRSTAAPAEREVADDLLMSMEAMAEQDGQADTGTTDQQFDVRSDRGPAGSPLDDGEPDAGQDAPGSFLRPDESGRSGEPSTDSRPGEERLQRTAAA